MTEPDSVDQQPGAARGPLIAHVVNPSILSEGEDRGSHAIEHLRFAAHENKPFFASLKGECLDQRTWLTRASARREIVDYIGWVNGARLHSALGHLSPNEVRPEHVVVADVIAVHAKRSRS